MNLSAAQLNSRRDKQYYSPVWLTNKLGNNMFCVGLLFEGGIRVHRHSNNAKKNTADMELPLKVPLAKFSFEKKGTKL